MKFISAKCDDHDRFDTEYATPEEAVEGVKAIWGHLTRLEKKKSTVMAAKVNDTYGEDIAEGAEE